MTKQEQQQANRELKYFGDNIARRLADYLGAEYILYLNTVKEDVFLGLEEKDIAALMIKKKGEKSIMFDMMFLFSLYETCCQKDIKKFTSMIGERIQNHFTYYRSTYTEEQRHVKN